MAASKRKKQSLPVYLGFPDDAIEAHHVKLVDFSTSKIGGQPDWISLPPPTYKDSGCGVCRGPTILVAQLYAPLDAPDAPHRTLYVVACPQPGCWNAPGSWKCFRGQKSIAVVSGTKERAVDHFKTTDWDDDAEDWGDENEDELNGNVVSRGVAELNLSPQRSSSSSSGVVAEHSDGQDCAGPAEVATAEIEGDVDPDMERLVIPEAAAEGAAGLDNDERIPRVRELLFPPRFCPDPKISITHFQPFFLAVDVERSQQEGHLTEHERFLLMEYKNQEDLTEVREDEKPSRGASGDSYEKAWPKHGDVYVHKMATVMRENPGQILRYCRDPENEPLFLGCPDSVPSECRHCEGPVLSEVQLLPSLVSWLKVEGEEDKTPLEFGTVIVYTCAKVCSGGGTGGFVEEQCCVQSEAI